MCYLFTVQTVPMAGLKALYTSAALAPHLRDIKTLASQNPEALYFCT